MDTLNVTPEVLADIEADLADATRDRDRADRDRLAPVGLAVLDIRVQQLTTLRDHARAHLGQDLTRPRPDAPAKKKPRRTLADLDRERLPARVARLQAVLERIAVYESTRSDHAYNNWRRRQAAIDRSLAAGRQYRKDLRERDRLLGLIRRTHRQEATT